MGRAPCCDKANVKKGPWSPEEDSKLKEYIDKYGTGGNWIALPHKAGMKRCGKSCRLRWLNYLRPNIKHGDFTDDEDRIICSLFVSIGSKWSIIAAQLPGRTDNDIKNYWNTKLKKKLLGIPQSHRKANQQQQQQHDNQLLFQSSLENSTTAAPSSLSQGSYNFNTPRSILASTEGFSFSSELLNTPHHLPQGYQSLVAHDQYHMKGNGDVNGNLLVFNGDQQSCSSSDGSITQNSYGFEGSLYGGIEETQKLLLGGGEPLLEYNYEEIKQMVLYPDNNSMYLDEPNSTASAATKEESISFKTHGRATYYY